MLLSSGYIAGGTIAGLLGLLLVFAPAKIVEWLDVGQHLPESLQQAVWPAVAAFSLLLVFLLLVGWGKLLAAGPARTQD